MSRRTLLRWSSVVLGGVGAVSLTACGGADDADSEPDPLIAQAQRARTDAATAAALVAVTPELAEALTTIDAERTVHADTLDAEIARAAGTTATTTPPSATAAPAAEPATVQALRERLARSQRDAAGLARTLQGYRAGLLGSISAACAAQTEVLLP